MPTVVEFILGPGDAINGVNWEKQASIEQTQAPLRELFLPLLLPPSSYPAKHLSIKSTLWCYIHSLSPATILFHLHCQKIMVDLTLWASLLAAFLGVLLLYRRLLAKDVHRDCDYWIFAESTQELLLQLRAECKDSWPGQWDISSAGHISARDSSLVTTRRELHEELGIVLPKDAFELLLVFLQEWWCHGSPVHRYDVYALQWIVEVNGKSTLDLDALVAVTKWIPKASLVAEKGC